MQPDALQVASAITLRTGQSLYTLGFSEQGSLILSAGIVSGLKRGIPSPTGQIIPGVIQVPSFGKLFECPCCNNLLSTTRCNRLTIGGISVARNAVLIWQQLQGLPPTVVYSYAAYHSVYNAYVVSVDYSFKVRVICVSDLTLLCRQMQALIRVLLVDHC